MNQSQPIQRVELDLNNPKFLACLLDLDKAQWGSVRATLKKLMQMDWQQVYRDQGLKWERITSVQPPIGIDAIYSLRISQSCRATAHRDGTFMRFLSVSSDHDAAYGKK